MTDLHVAPTDGLEESLLPELRGFLDAAFQGDFSDDDWIHTLGGVHRLTRTVCSDGRVNFVSAMDSRPNFL